MESEETYKKATLRLQQIISDIERNELDVDTLSEKVKEATYLIKFCKERLYKVDEEVQKILEELDNE
ncbi:MAG: exodeoxyribonuclease VII small subunit [Massilibacteroides sp.]|nr:exodeoxyribonuclease VII small subunit [Massilibacteroides sp.]